MSLINLLDTPDHAIWQESNADNFDGGSTVQITTPFLQTMTARHKQIVGKLTLFGATGTPDVETTFCWHGGLFELTLHNRATSGNKAAFTLDLQEVAETGGDFSPSISVVPATSEPSANTALRFYVDGTSGDDAASGQGGWANAWKTVAKLTAELAALLAPQPPSLEIVIFYRGTFSEEMHLSVFLTGTTQVHLVHAIDDFTTIRSGTIAAVGGEAPAPTHGMERLTLAGASLDGTEVGMTLRLDDPVSGSRGTCTIGKVDAPNQYVWVNQMIGEFPTWVATSPANVIVCRPSAYFPSTVCLEYERGSGISASTPAQKEPYSYVIGLRCAGYLFVRGSGVGLAGCYIRSSGGTWNDITAVSTNTILEGYQRTPTDYNLTDALATEFGLIRGPTPTTYNTLGNAAQGCSERGNNHYVTGYFTDRVGGYGSSNIFDRIYAGYLYLLGTYGQFSACVSRASSASYGAVHCHHGAMRISKFAMMDIPAAGAVAGIFRCERNGATIDCADTYLSGINTGTGTDLRVGWIKGGGLIFRSGFGVGLRSKHRQLVAEEGGGIVSRGAVTFGANEGGGPDAYAGAGGSFIEFQHNVAKSATNPSGGGVAQPVLKWERGGRISQASGKAFTLPAGSGDNVADYGADGAIVGSDSEAVLGTFTGAGAGTTGPACTLTHGAKLRHGGAGPSGTAPLKFHGAAAAQAWPAAPTSDAAVAVPEGCWVYPNVT